MLREVLTVSALILAVLLVRAVFRDRVPKRMVYAIWLVVLLKLCLPGTLVSLPVLPAEEAAAPVQRVEAPAQTAPVVQQPAQAVTQPPVQQPVSAARAVAEPAAKPLTAMQIFQLVWACGSALLGLWLFGTWLVFTVRLHKSRKFLGKRGKTNIYVSNRIKSPCLAGPIPAVYLTEDVVQTEEAELILRHELTHLRHLDLLWSFCRTAAVIAYWWNPFIWLAAILSKRDAELACDEAVAAGLSDAQRLAYARAILAQAPRKAAALSLAGPPVRERILFLTKKQRTSVLCVILALLLVVSAAGCSITELTRQKSGEITLPEEAPTEAPSESAQAEPELPVRESAPEETQTLHERLFYASVCTCLMEDSARWHLLQLGMETDAPGDVFSGAMDAFGRALSAYPGDTFMDDAFWLIDTKYQGLELQFWKYNSSGHPDRLSCTAAFYWEPGMTDADLLGEDLLLHTLDWASCTKDASEEERTRIQEQYEHLLPDFSSGTGWRVSLAPDGTLALTALDPEHGASIYYAHDVVHEPMIFRGEDLPQQYLEVIASLAPSSDAPAADSLSEDMIWEAVHEKLDYAHWTQEMTAEYEEIVRKFDHEDSKRSEKPGDFFQWPRYYSAFIDYFSAANADLRYLDADTIWTKGLSEDQQSLIVTMTRADVILTLSYSLQTSQITEVSTRRNVVMQSVSGDSVTAEHITLLNASLEEDLQTLKALNIPPQNYWYGYYRVDSGEFYTYKVDPNASVTIYDIGQEYGAGEDRLYTFKTWQDFVAAVQENEGLLVQPYTFTMRNGIVVKIEEKFYN